MPCQNLKGTRTGGAREQAVQAEAELEKAKTAAAAAMAAAAAAQERKAGRGIDMDALDCPCSVAAPLQRLQKFDCRLVLLRPSLSRYSDQRYKGQLSESKVIWC